MGVPAVEPAGGTRSDIREPASSSNGLLGGPPTNNRDDVKSDIDMDNENVAAQEENEDVTMGFIGSLEPTADDFASEMILMAMGSCGKSRLRETRTACRRLGKAMVSEMYSPPRVTAELIRSQKQFRTLLPGFALDLTVNDPEDGQPWDFSKSGKRNKALKMVRRDEPYMVIGSPHCTAFTTWQALNEARSSNPDEMRRARNRAIKHIEFMVMIYEEQLSNGRYFLHEHPMYATSWQLSRMKNLMEMDGVERVRGDQCQYGATASRGPKKGGPVMKPT